MNKNTKIIIGLLVIVIILLGYLAFKPKNADITVYNNKPIISENKDNKAVLPVVNSPKTVLATTGQANWYIPNQTGWTEHTLTWKTYSTGNASFKYPPAYVVETKQEETRPEIYINQTVITNPNSRSETDDTIYLDIPYTGASNPYDLYDIKENINNTGLTLAIRKDASNYGKYIFSNVVASVAKKP